MDGWMDGCLVQLTAEAHICRIFALVASSKAGVYCDE